MPLGGVIFISIFVALFGSGLLWLASKMGTRVADKVKFETYECGLPAEEKADTKISLSHYKQPTDWIEF